MFLGLCVRAWVRVCQSVRPENIVNNVPVSQKPVKASLAILVTDVFGFTDVLVRFVVKRSKVKITAGRVITVDGSPSNSIEFYPNVTTLRSGLCYRKSVCRLSVCNVRAPYSWELKLSAIFLRLLYLSHLLTPEFTNHTLYLQHAPDCNPCLSPHARLKPAPVVRRSVVHCTTRQQPDPLTDIDLLAAIGPPRCKVTAKQRSSGQAVIPRSKHWFNSLARMRWGREW